MLPRRVSRELERPASDNATGDPGRQRPTAGNDDAGVVAGVGGGDLARQRVGAMPQPSLPTGHKPGESRRH